MSPRTGVAGDTQASFEDEVIEDDAFEALLEERESRNATKREATKLFKTAHEQVRDRITALVTDLEIPIDQPIRCGRFVVTRREVEAQSVEFERGGSVRVSIRRVKEKDDGE